MSKPAFPSEISSGMSLRDYFAAKAMQGSLADDAVVHSPAAFAEWCYELADAMLEAREK